jgi:hypothetical protein
MTSSAQAYLNHVISGLNEAKLRVEAGYSVDYIWRQSCYVPDFLHGYFGQIAEFFLHGLKSRYQNNLMALQRGEYLAYLLSYIG